jgi:hypothetical protein
VRRTFLRLEVVAVVIVAACLVSLSLAHKPARAQIQLLLGPGGPLALSNDKEGSAVLSLGGMRPGDSVTDTVTLGNTGTVPGDLSLATSDLVDTPGAGGGALSGKLGLRIRDVTAPGSPVTVYDNTIDAFTPVALGTLAAGSSRVYEFRVAFPDAGPGAENAYQGSSMSVRLDWSAVNNGPDTDPPETTITSGPSPVSASPNATFAFTADEAGSTFECSLDGGPFTACTSPASSSSLADGPHTFEVRATDGSNTDSTPDSASWTVDQTAPTVALADPGSPLRGTVSLVPSADDGTGTGVTSLIVQRSAAGAGAWSATGTSWNTRTIADGVYDLRARATDAAGNTASSAVQTVTVDNGLPSKPKKFAGARKKTRLVLSWKPATDGAGSIAAYLVYVNGALSQTLGGSTLSVNMGPFKTSDARAFQVAARDAAGNVGKETRALVIVPSLERLTVAKAKSRLAGRGLKLGHVKYEWSRTVARGLVLDAGSGVVAKGSAVGLTVSRGRAPSGRPSETGGGTTGYQPGSGYYPGSDYQPGAGWGETTSDGAVDSGEPSTPTASEAGGEGQTGSPAPGPESDGADQVVRSSYSATEAASSPVRRMLGLGLLGGAFLAAGTAVLRARRPRGTRAQTESALEPLVFWDERLLHAASSVVRRLSGRL